MVNIKIFPIIPAVRPTVLRFLTSLSLPMKKLNESDILDASVLVRHANVDDSGTYRCIVRQWSTDPLANLQEILFNDDSSVSSLNYQVQFSGPPSVPNDIGSVALFLSHANQFAHDRRRLSFRLSSMRGEQFQS